MSARYKSPVGILFLVLEMISILVMAFTLENVFDSPLQIIALIVGVLLLTILGLVFAMIADSWIGTVIGALLALAITSPIFYYVWKATGWPAAGFLCVSILYATLRSWRKEAEAEAEA
jgi:hypothetical protein